MPSHAARFADHTRCARKQGRPAGQGPLNHQNTALGEGKHVCFLAGNKHRPHAHAGAYGNAAAGQHGKAFGQIFRQNFALARSHRCAVRNIGAVFRGGIRLVQRAALQHHNTPVAGIKRPLHILRLGVVFFQRQRNLRKVCSLRIRKAGWHARKPCKGLAYGLRRIGAGKNKNIRCNCAVHHGLRQARHGIEQHLLLPARGCDGIPAVSHAAGGSGHHGKHTHAHGRGIIRDTVLIAIAHGGHGILAGDNFFPDFAGFFRRHIKLGTVLPGKGNTQRIFAHGAAAQGKGKPRPGPALHGGHGLCDFLLQFRRQGRAEHGLLQGRRKAENFIQTVHIRSLNAAVQLAVQAAVFHKAVVGADSHGKTIGHVQPRVGRHFAQIGHLAAHKGDVVQADIAERHDIGPVLMRLLFKQALHLRTNPVKGLLQRLVAFI